MANRMLNPMGAEIRRLEPRALSEPAHDLRHSYMEGNALRSALLDELTAVAEPFLEDLRMRGPDSGIGDIIEQFWSVYRERPFGANPGGSGFHSAFWIYVFAKLRNPKLIVESGVWKGQTSWLLEQACPGAEIHGFDIDLSRLEHHSPRIRFHEHDWSAYDFGSIDPEKSLVFFDCHVNQAKRLQEAAERGFRHLLFDDNAPLHKLYAYGLPGFPTIDMVVNQPVEVSVIAWQWCGARREYRIDPEEIARARELIEAYAVFPDVGGRTRYGGFSFLSYVRLKVRPTPRE